MRPTGSPEELEHRRLRALVLLSQGKLPSEVAKLVGVDRRSVRRWKATIREDGEKGLRARPASGRPPKLKAKDRRKLEGLLLKGPLAAGFGTDLWTCPRVAELIEQRFAVQYHVDHVGRLLHDLGWSPQKPTRRAIERDEQEIRRWVREDWQRVKKTPVVAARRSSSSTKPDS
jgi:transposase